MANEKQSPVLLQLLFGEAARTAEMGASERLQRWCEGFEGWLEERRENYSASTYKHSRLAWKRFFGHYKSMPWELGKEDFEDYAAWMEEEGYSPHTTNQSMGILANFYRWCEKNRIDVENEVGFNPAAEARRPAIRRYERAKMLSRGESETLLDLYRRDETLVGMRDYAFMLARLRTGVRLEALRKLRWGADFRNKKAVPAAKTASDGVGDGGSPAIAGERAEGTREMEEVEPPPEASLLLGSFSPDPSLAPSLRSGQGSGQGAKLQTGVRLPGEVWEAIYRYLEAAGRLEGGSNQRFELGSFEKSPKLHEKLTAEKYVFAPLAETGLGAVKGVAEEWLEERAVSASQLLSSLKRYGKQLGIPEERLTLMGLRNTAIRLRMEAGASIEEMRAFMDSRSEDRQVKYRLKKLTETKLQVNSFSPDSSLRSGQGPKLHGVEPPNRNPHPFKPWDGYRHGLYAESQPTEGVAAVLRENIQGMEEEIVGLRLLGRGLLERHVGAKSSLEGVRLGDAYTKTAARLAEMMRVEKQMAEEEAGKGDTEELLERWDKMAIGMGGEPVSEQIRAEAFSESPEMAVAARRLVEEIASIRYVLRNTFQLAMGEEDDGEYRHLVEIYSAGCARLVRLLRMEGYKEDRVRAYIDESIEIALKEVMEELGIGG